MDPALDLVERLPVLPLLGTALGAAVGALGLAALVGGTVAVALLVVGVVIVAVAGGLAALKVHLARLPLEVAPVAVEGRIDGHRAFAFRVRLGRGRGIDRGLARVRYLPDHGEPVDLHVLLADARGVVGPWAVVAVDRAEAVRGAGRLEVAVEAEEDGHPWVVEASWGLEDVVPGRFEPVVQVRRGRLAWARDRWTAVQPPALPG